MKTLYIECKMGAAGDMLMAALYELLPETEKNKFLHTMNHLFGEDLKLSPSIGAQCGIAGTHMHVVTLHGAESPAADSRHQTDIPHKDAHPHPHPLSSREEGHVHYSYPAILERIGDLPLPDSVKRDAAAIYRLIGEAEAKVHGCTLEQIHFHEVGSLDAIADVIGSCLLISMIKPDAIYASPIHVGNGTVCCAHGILPVPAPATAELLRGIPYYSGDIQSELCTPTGAAILKYFSAGFLPMPVMTVDAVGIGLGTKEFEAANCVRIFYGDLCEESLLRERAPIAAQDHVQNAHGEKDCGEADRILELSCNLDDMTGEELGYAMEVLLNAGALDVFYTSIYMKKNRPGVLLSCFCPPSEKERFTELIFLHTSTRGIRFQSFSRAKLSARFEELETEYGIVRKKISEGRGAAKSKYEYEDLCRIAREQGISLAEVRRLLISP